jgi:hypothetical protein
MTRLYTEEPFTCVTCELEIRAHPVFHVGLPFCCPGCVAGGPCMCSYDEASTAVQGLAERALAPDSVGAGITQSGPFMARVTAGAARGGTRGLSYPQSRPPARELMGTAEPVGSGPTGGRGRPA